MRFVMFKGEKSVNDLATRVFRIQGRGSQAAAKQAADALLKANPQLKDLSKVPVGSLIAIPDTAPPVASEETAIAAGLVRSVAAQNIQTVLDTFHQRLSDIESSAVDRVESNIDRLQTQEAKTAVKTIVGTNLPFADQAPNLEAIAKSTAQTVKNVQKAQDARKQAVAQLRTDVASFANK